MKMNFTEIGVQDKLKLFDDGQPVVNHFESLLNTVQLEFRRNERRQVMQPVALLFLDINMPYTGIEVVQRIKELYR